MSKKEIKEEEVGKDDYGPPNQKVSNILSDLIQAVDLHRHLADESQTR